MKNAIEFIKYVLALLVLLFITSCARDDNYEAPDENEQEAFLSTTGNSDSPEIEEVGSEGLDGALMAYPVMQMHFDAEMSHEEAKAIFDNQFKEFMKTYESEEKAFSTEWFFKVWTYTGTQTDNDTDGTVHASVNFFTDKGTKHTTYMNLDNFGNDREGGWEVYVLRTFIPGQAVSYVRANHAHIRLQGKDGWFLRDYYVYVTRFDQSLTATGGSFIVSHPNVWLDNNSSSAWDYYYTGNIGYGTLNF